MNQNYENVVPLFIVRRINISSRCINIDLSMVRGFNQSPKMQFQGPQSRKGHYIFVFIFVAEGH